MKLLFVCFIVASLPFTSFGQSIDCNSDSVRIGLRKGKTLVAPCDSMVVLTNYTYAKMALDAKLTQDGLSRLNEIRDSQASLISAYEKDIESLEKYIDTADVKIDELHKKLDQSIQNTDEAVMIAKRNKFLWGGAGAALGILIGIIVQ